MFPFSRLSSVAFVLSVAAAVSACDVGDVSGSETPSVSGASSSGGATSVSGASSSGGATAVSGTSSSGGATAVSGASSSGGAPGVSGASSSGGAPAVSGASSSGGAPGVSGASSSAAGRSFVLDWEDNFDVLDASLWELQTFSWDGNLAQFSTANATASSGVLSINLTAQPSDTAKPYRGVELRSLKTITYGKVEARIRFAHGSGLVSGLVLIYTPYPADDWNEIDIEHLGKSSGSVQLNCQVYTGPATVPPVTKSVAPTQDPLIADLGFDAEADFHLYAMEWTPTDVRFTIDGKLVRTWTKDIARMHLPQNVLFTIWASDSASWAGPLTSSSAPSSAQIDWIKVSRLAQ